MSSGTEIDVEKVAKLARLELSADEVSRFQAQLGDVLEYIKKLGELDVSGIEETAHANPVFDVMREDVSRPGMDRDDALSNAPAKTREEFLVTKVVE